MGVGWGEEGLARLGERQINRFVGEGRPRDGKRYHSQSPGDGAGLNGDRVTGTKRARLHRQSQSSRNPETVVGRPQECGRFRTAELGPKPL